MPLPTRLPAGEINFTDLIGTPSSYTGYAGKFVRVVATENGLEFADIAAADLPSEIDATKIGTGVVDNTEFGYLNGVTSGIQDQLNASLLADGSRPLAGNWSLAGYDLTNLGKLNFDDATTLTIATGAITITQSYHAVDTEAAAATDDLDTINGGMAGDLIYLKAADGTHTVVLKHGTGNIVTPDGSDYSLDDANKAVELICDSAGTWHLVGSAGGGPGSDTTAIHDNVSGEIAAIAEKTAPVAADKLLIEDSAANNAKKMVQIAHLAYGKPPLGQAGDPSWANRTYEGWEIFDTAHIYTVGSGGDFATLADAAAALQGLILTANLTVQLLEDITLSSRVVFQGLISSGGVLILDLNAHNITIDFDNDGIVASGPFSFWPRDLNSATGNASIIAGSSAGSSTTLMRFDLGAKGLTYNIDFDANSVAIAAMLCATNKARLQLNSGTTFSDTGGGGAYASAVLVQTGAVVAALVTGGVSADDFSISSGGLVIDSDGDIHTAKGEWNTPDA